jgi:hypothetical protein
MGCAMSERKVQRVRDDRCRVDSRVVTKEVV